MRVLNAAGVEVIVPRDQGCCGAITIHAGDMPRGRELAKRNIAAFERSGADVYVINAAGCGSALKEYGHLFHGDAEWENRAIAFSAKVRDVLEYVDELGSAGSRVRRGARDRDVPRRVPSRARAAHHRAAAPAAREDPRAGAARDGRVVAVLRLGGDLQRDAAGDVAAAAAPQDRAHPGSGAGDRRHGESRLRAADAQRPGPRGRRAHRGQARHRTGGRVADGGRGNGRRR